MLVDEAAQSIETCQLSKLNFFLISSTILFWPSASFSSTITNCCQNLIFSYLKHSSRSNSLRSADVCAKQRSKSLSLPGSSRNWDPKTQRVQEIWYLKIQKAHLHTWSSTNEAEAATHACTCYASKCIHTCVRVVSPASQTLSPSPIHCVECAHSKLIACLSGLTDPNLSIFHLQMKEF